jgi:glycosyltransferase involved in cell wall biosynthesis
VGIVARLVPIKAHEVFLAAARELTARRPDVRFLVIGDGERRAELERLAGELGLGPRVLFLGWRGDLDRIYADLDVVALTSRNEGSPVALIEAMAAGRAVVSTRVGGVPDVVADAETGRLVPVDDAGALAAAMDTLLADRVERERLGAAARLRVLATYGADRLVADVDQLYRRLLSARGL